MRTDTVVEATIRARSDGAAQRVALPLGTGVCQCGGSGRLVRSVTGFDAHRAGPADARHGLTADELLVAGLTTNGRGQQTPAVPDGARGAAGCRGGLHCGEPVDVRTASLVVSYARDWSWRSIWRRMRRDRMSWSSLRWLWAALDRLTECQETLVRVARTEGEDEIATVVP